MKGVVLAGGTGSRLYPLTRITNKHLLPVYDQPMIYYPIQLLMSAGVTDVMIVTGGNHAGEFLPLLGSGSAFGLKHIDYSYQERAGGIADALRLARHFASGDRIVVALADNIFEYSIRPSAERFVRQQAGARVLLVEVERPQAYGVAVMRNEKITEIIEKPDVAPSPYAVAGCYFYDSTVFDIVETLKPSRRGELELTDVNNAYVARGELEYDVVQGYYADCGESFDSYLRANNLVAKFGHNKDQQPTSAPIREVLPNVAE